MLGSPPSGDLILRNEGNEGSGLFGVWGGREGRGLSQAGILALGARVDPDAREGHLRAHCRHGRGFGDS